MGDARSSKAPGPDGSAAPGPHAWRVAEPDAAAIDWQRLLADEVALVTGAGAGIGRAIAELFAAHGARLELVEIDADRLSSVVEQLKGRGVDVVGHLLDVRSPDAVADMAHEVVERRGGLDVLVNNVGDYRPLVRFDESTPESWQAMYEINLLHVFSVTRAFLGPMADSGGGSIVNIHSVEGMRGFPGEPVYAAMKAAVAHFTTSLAVGWGRKGIRVNGIGTDLTQTPQVDYLRGHQHHPERWESWAPVGRVGWPADQANVALFLASRASAFVTGHNVPVDGGTLAGGGWFWSPAECRFQNRPTLD